MSKKNSKSSSKKVVSATVAAKIAHAPAIQAAPPSDADIAVRAYEIYVSEGRPEGRHLDHWQRAASELGLG